MNNCVIVATHHKTGSVWMASTFKKICAALNIRFIHMKRERTRRASAKPPVVFFDGHSAFVRRARWMLDLPELRIFHLIRDPRDVVISAMNYHLVSDEPWLHKPQDRYHGKTYHQMINGLPDDRQRYLFEMENSASRVINDMRTWNYENPSSFECKYEDLIGDTEMLLFGQAADHLGFSPEEVVECRRRFWQASIFGGKSPRKESIKHVRSGRAGQWSKVFDRDLANAFVAKFGDVLVTLGYEPDNSWTEALPSNRSNDHGLRP
jgi:hypothetical protein